MASEKLIHIKLEYSEALQSKSDMLTSEMVLLRMARTMQRYRKLRLEELKTKSKINARMKDLVKAIKELQKNLPEPKLPKILKHDEEEEPEKAKKDEIKQKVREKLEEENIEAQIRKIQEELKRMQV